MFLMWVYLNVIDAIIFFKNWLGSLLCEVEFKFPHIDHLNRFPFSYFVFHFWHFINTNLSLFLVVTLGIMYVEILKLVFVSSLILMLLQAINTEGFNSVFQMSQSRHYFYFKLFIFIIFSEELLLVKSQFWLLYKCLLR